METWKTVTPAPAYEVSSYGRVRHKKLLKVLKPWHINGYATVRLWLNGKYGGRKTFKVHRLVAREFLEDPTGKVVDHIDRNRVNNDYRNLRVTNHFSNMGNRHLKGLSVINQIIDLHKQGLAPEQIAKAI